MVPSPQERKGVLYLCVPYKAAAQSFPCLTSPSSKHSRELGLSPTPIRCQSSQAPGDATSWEAGHSHAQGLPLSGPAASGVPLGNQILVQPHYHFMLRNMTQKSCWPPSTLSDSPTYLLPRRLPNADIYFLLPSPTYPDL